VLRLVELLGNRRKIVSVDVFVLLPLHSRIHVVEAADYKQQTSFIFPQTKKVS